MKVKKITPIKTANASLCDKCKYGWKNHCSKHSGKCKDCKMHGGKSGKRCICPTIIIGQPCPYFERYVEEAQQ